MVSRPRHGKRHFGVPPSGPFDLDSALISNLLIGNPELEVCLEVGPFGMSFLTESTCSLAIAGADRLVTLDGQSVTCNGTFTCEVGQVLRLGPTTRGARSYLSANGGFEPSSLETGAFVAIKGVPIATDPRSLSAFPLSVLSQTLRVLPGPEGDLAYSDLCSRRWVVSPNSSRRGLRLQGEPLTHNISLASEPQVVGAVQLPPDGQPIILGPDGPTLGGYPKVAVICQADVSRLGQILPGAEVQFQAINFKAAKHLASEQSVLERQWRTILKSLG